MRHTATLVSPSTIRTGGRAGWDNCGRPRAEAVGRRRPAVATTGLCWKPESSRGADTGWRRQRKILFEENAYDVEDYGDRPGREEDIRSLHRSSCRTATRRCGKVATLRIIGIGRNKYAPSLRRKCRTAPQMSGSVEAEGPGDGPARGKEAIAKLRLMMPPITRNSRYRREVPFRGVVIALVRFGIYRGKLPACPVSLSYPTSCGGDWRPRAAARPSAGRHDRSIAGAP